MRKLNSKGFGAVEVLLLILLAGIIGGIGYYIWHSNKTSSSKSSSNAATVAKSTVKNFDDCVAAGNPVATSFPAKCTAGGQTFTQDVSQSAIEKASSANTKYSKLPKGLQQVILAETKKIAPNCVKDDQLVDMNGKPYDQNVAYAPIGSAITPIGCEDSAASLFAKDQKTGTWKYITSTQFGFSCDDIFNNPVPKSLLELNGGQAQCLEKASNGDFTTYDQASKARFE